MPTQEHEEWRPIPIPEYEVAYDVSSLGRVRRTKQAMGAVVWRILKPHYDPKYNYMRISLSLDSKVHSERISSLVARAFLPPPPSPDHVPAHRDGDHRNCRASNLYWAIKDTVRHGSAKVTPRQAEEIRLLEGVETSEHVAQRYHVHRATVYRIWNGNTFK